MSPASDHDCAYGTDDCKKPSWRCRPTSVCPKAGVTVYRDKYTQGGHHHLADQKEKGNDPREPAR